MSENPHIAPSRLMLFSTAELVREITNRHPTSVVAWTECQDNGDPDARAMKYEMGGDIVGNMGLAAGVVDLCRRTFNEQTRRNDA